MSDNRESDVEVESLMTMAPMLARLAYPRGRDPHVAVAALRCALHGLEALLLEGWGEPGMHRAEDLQVAVQCNDALLDRLSVGLMNAMLAEHPELEGPGADEEVH